MKKNKFISNNSTLIDIEKQKFLIMNDKYFNNPNELNVFFYMLFNDYYTVYINNNSNNEQEDQEEQKK